jgi:hypothetical protein
VACIVAEDFGASAASMGAAFSLETNSPVDTYQQESPQGTASRAHIGQDLVESVR